MKRISFAVSLFSLGIAFVVWLSVSGHLSAQGGRVNDAVRKPIGSSTKSGQNSVTNQKNGSAAQSRSAQPDANQPQPGDVELKASRVYAFVGKTGLGHEHAIVGNLKSGEVHLGNEQRAGKLEFDLRSFIADTADARRYIGLKGETDRATAQKVTNNMLGPDVLNVGQFPIATFEIAAIKKQRDLKDGAVEYLFDGDFSLHGVARRVRFTAVAEPVKGWQRVRGRFTIRQTDFGITPFTTALGAIGVADELTIYGDLWVRPEQPLADKSEDATR